MAKIPPFFLPDVAPDSQELSYSEFARWSQRPAPSLAERVYSVTWTHNGEDWTATVGERLRGTKRRRARNGAEHTEYLTDPAMVLAILPGNPSLVFTNANNDVRSAWSNPINIGRSKSIVLFAPSA